MGEDIPFPMANHRGVYITMLARSGFLLDLGREGKLNLMPVFRAGPLSQRIAELIRFLVILDFALQENKKTMGNFSTN